MILLRAPAKIDLTDNFNRSNGTPGSNWSTYVVTGQAGIYPIISSNAMGWSATTTNNTNTQQAAIYTGQALNTTNHIVRGKFVTDWSNGLINGGFFRCNSGFTKGVCWYTHDANVWMATLTSGTWTTQFTTSHSGWNASDIFEIRCVGNYYSMWANPDTSPVLKGSWTDSSNVYPIDNTQRYCGLFGQSDCNFFGAQGFAPFIDDFRMRDY